MPGAPPRMAPSRFARIRSGGSSRRLRRRDRSIGDGPVLWFSGSDFGRIDRADRRSLCLVGFDRILVVEESFGIERRRRRDLVGAGRQSSGQDIAIVDPIAVPPGPDAVGEIWVQSDERREWIPQSGSRVV